MARINLYGNTERAVEVAKFLACEQHRLTIITAPEENEEPGYRWKLDLVKNVPYHDTCDVILAINWRKMIPQEVLVGACSGAFCLHDSLLPAYRGSSPVVWAVEEGAKETGVTMFRMNDRIDAGPIIGQRRIDIKPGETVRQVWDRLTPLYVDLIRAHLPAILNGTIVEREQTELGPIRKRREWPK